MIKSLLLLYINILILINNIKCESEKKYDCKLDLESDKEKELLSRLGVLRNQT